MGSNGDWTVASLGEIADEVTVGFVGPMASEYVDIGVPFLRSQNVDPFSINNVDLKYINRAFHARISKSRLRKDDVVIVRTGKPGTAAVVPEWLHDANCSDLVIVRPGRRLNPRFLAYFVNSVARHHVYAYVVGAVQQHFNVGSAKEMAIPLPSMVEQEAIVRVLGVLDDKIELNRRMNQTLEALARALFKSWFVDFDPVVAKAAGKKPVGMSAQTAALFPDRFQDSALGPIPKGWRVGTFGEIARNVRFGATPGDVSPDTVYIALEHMPRRSIALSEWGKSDGIMSQKSRFERGDVLFGKLRPYFHKVGIAPADGVCSTDILVIRPTTACWSGLTLMWASSDEMVQHADNTSGGTKMPRTSWDDLSRFQVVVPPELVGASFSTQIARISAKITDGIYQSRSIAALRDALLPQLMSGELRVKRAESQVEEVV